MTVFIGNLAFDVTEKHLQDYFGELGVKKIHINKTQDGNSEGYGYIEFDDSNGLKSARMADGCHFMGRRITVSETLDKCKDRIDPSPNDPVDNDSDSDSFEIDWSCDRF